MASLAQSLGGRDGDGNDSVRLKAERTEARGCSWKSVEKRHTYINSVSLRLVRLGYASRGIAGVKWHDNSQVPCKINTGMPD